MVIHRVAFLYDKMLVMVTPKDLVLTKVRNTEDMVSIPVQQMLEFFFVSIVH